MVILHQILVWGVILILWFSPLARASWDLWAVTLIHNFTLLLLILGLVQRNIATEDTEFTEKQKTLKRFKVLNSIFSVFWSLPRFFHRGGFRGKKFSFLTKIDGAILVFILIAGISAINSEDFATSRNELFNLVNYGLLYWLIVSSTDDKDRQLIVKNLLLIGGVISLFGIYQFLRILEAGSPVTSQVITNLQRIYQNQLNITSTLVNPNILAGYLVMLIPLGVAMVGEALSVRRQALGVKSNNLSIKGHFRLTLYALLLTVILMLICLLLTGAEWAILALGGVMVGMGFWFFRNRPLKQRLGWLLIVSILLLGGGVLFVRKLASPELLNRVWWWQTALRMTKSHPFLGVGPGAFESMYLKYKLWGKGSLYAHNHFLQIAAEMGVFGLATFIGILICFFRLAIPQPHSGKSGHRLPITPKSFATGQADYRLPFISITVVLLHNLVDYNLCIPANAILFWTLLALSRKSVGVKREASGVRRNLRLAPYGLLLTILLIFVGMVGIKVNKIFLANRQYALGQYAATREERGQRLKKAIALDPKVAQYHIARGDFYLQQGKFSRAEVEYLTAIHYQPSIAHWHYKLGNVYLCTGRYSQAKEELLKTVVLARDNPRYWFKLGEAYEKDRDLKAARYTRNIARKIESLTQEFN